MSFRLKLILALIPFCAVTLPAAAQKGIFDHIDSLLAERQQRSAARYDTAYITRPYQPWTVRLGVNASGTDLYSRGNISGTQFSSDLSTTLKATVGVNVSYRGLSLGFSLNPARLSGKNKDYEFNLNAYGNRMGLDLLITSAETFSGDVERGGETVRVAPGKVSMKSIQTNIYYSFNRRRFSFPAAFSQSQLQKHSCSSWLLGLSALGGRIDNSDGSVSGSAPVRLTVINVGLGAGYAYNFVWGGRWLLHLSAMPQIVVYSHSRLTVGDGRQRAPFKFPSIINVGRIAGVRYFGNKFIGFSAIINMWHHGDSDRLSVESLKWRARLFYGFRF